jgi:TolB-like protein
LIQPIKETIMFDTAAISKAIPAHGINVVRKPAPEEISAIVSHPGPNLPSRRDLIKGKAADTALALDGLENLAASAPAIRQQLARMLQSPIFVQSDRLNRFLQFIVEHVIGGNQNYLKEYVIGSEVYDRRPPYNPNQDSIVRTEARRLRGKLKEYYETEGKDDPIYIYLRPGSYIPVLQYKAALAGFPRVVDINDPSLSAKIPAVTIAILPFHDITGSALSSTYARGIPDELAFTLMQTEGCRVIAPASMAHFNAQEHDVATAMSKVGAQIAYEGSVREEANHIRVTATIVDAIGFQLWTKRFDTKAGSQTIFTTEEEIASALSAGFEALFGISKRPNSA